MAHSPREGPAAATALIAASNLKQTFSYLNCVEGTRGRDKNAAKRGISAKRCKNEEDKA